MFTKAAFHELNPDLIIHLIPLGHPPRTMILSQIVNMLSKEYPDLLVDGEHSILALNTRKVVKVR